MLDLLGTPLGSLLAPKTNENSLGTPLGAAKSCSRVLFGAPNAKVDAPRARAGALQEAFRRPRSSKRPPGSHFGPIWCPFGTRLGSILDHLDVVFLAGEKGLASLPDCGRLAICEVAGFGGAAPCEIRPPSFRQESDGCGR